MDALFEILKFVDAGAALAVAIIYLSSAFRPYTDRLRRVILYSCGMVSFFAAFGFFALIVFPDASSLFVPRYFRVVMLGVMVLPGIAVALSPKDIEVIFEAEEGTKLKDLVQRNGH